MEGAETVMLAQRLGILSDRNFARLWTARTVSMVGDYAFRIALITYVIERTQSPEILAFVIGILLVPTLIFYLLGGVAGDRARSRARILVVTDLVRLVAGVAMAAITLATGDLVLLVALAVVLSIGEGFYRPASFALLPELVAKDRLVKANSANSVGMQIAIIGGPLVGAGMAAILGPASVFAFNAATFLLSAALVAGIRPPSELARPEPDRTKTRSGPRGVLADVRGGLSYLLDVRWLLVTCLVGAAANAVFVGSLDVSVPLVLAPGGTEEAGSLGWFYALQGVGALVGAVILTRLVVVRLGIGLVSTLAMMAASLAAVGLLGAIPLVYLLPVFYGIGLHFFNSLYPTLLQSKVPQEMLGRVGSFTILSFQGLMPLGAVLTGPLAAALGAGSTLLIANLAVIGVCLVALVLPDIRALRTEQAGTQVGSRSTEPESS